MECPKKDRGSDRAPKKEVPKETKRTGPTKFVCSAGEPRNTKRSARGVAAKTARIAEGHNTDGTDGPCSTSNRGGGRSLFL